VVAASSGRIENMLTINVESISEVVVLRCSGRIVCGHETALLCSAMQQESRNVVLDLTEVDAIDAAGVGALLSLQAAGVYLKLLNPSRQVREILKATRLNSIFEICESQSIAETKQSMPEGRSDNQSERFIFASSPNV
jgi:anti-anti-sigma factor